MDQTYSELYSVKQVDVSTENLGELLVSDSPAAPMDSTTQMGSSLSQVGDNLEDDAVYRVHVEKDFIAFCSSTPRTCPSVADRDWGA